MSNVHSPSHYARSNIQPWDYIEANGLGFHLGSAVKYITRAGHKNPDAYVEDLEKAREEIARQIEVYEAENK